ncbi:hypothetical protein RUESEDTHA_00635 [Ruegeria sp. THAF57]|uniref:DUF167 domain-containing protein n=1 Tax=Ruegeria sp. THAF57 TaxID=2744555 RepID=UPI0015DEB464|nr:DUF167 domain-containing protein [Ruegeria sp. THAF57]CAD0183760.1 hypothetical protein RUESEDTHA_00635 [Ruegeria sp. THAF57]
MARAKPRDFPDLNGLAKPGARFKVKVIPKSASDRMTFDNGSIRIHVAAPPENGKANQTVSRILASSLGVAPSHLVLARGHAARDKVFVYEP